MQINEIITESVLVEGKISDLIARGKEIASNLIPKINPKIYGLVKGQVQDEVKNLVKLLFDGQIKSKQQLKSEILRIVQGLEPQKGQLSEQFEQYSDDELVKLLHYAEMVRRGPEPNNDDKFKLTNKISGIGVAITLGALALPVVNFVWDVFSLLFISRFHHFADWSLSEWLTTPLISLVVTLLLAGIAGSYEQNKLKNVENGESAEERYYRIKSDPRVQNAVRNTGIRRYNYLKNKRSEVGLTYSEQEELHNLYNSGFR